MDDDGMGGSSNGKSQGLSNWMNIWRHATVFTPRELHVGKQLRVVITYVDQGNLETLISLASNPVQNVNDKPTGAPILTGNAQEEDALVDTSC